ncbi:FAS1 domain-containing protein [Jimgerdemannia flammicorona]|uniref:FAS1 domain-containing protein n=1 Tax=Jimgerdemannia flammicorona TaxID=994334 RepID=A0A433DEE5_9FUNG|nr:FAS1 domain-containing protein [Jimgerdemannia flammicorona]
MIPVAIGLFFFIFLVVGLTSNSTSPVNRATPPGRIVDVLDEDPRFTTLVATLRRNGLASYLNAVEGATFFAPTDNAFHGQNGQFTHETLLYHLLPVRVNGGGLTNGLVLETDLIKAGSLGETGHIGQRVKIERTGSWWTGEKVVVGGAPVVQMDKGAENGVIHVLDKVLVPPHELSDAAAAFPTLTTFSELLDASGLHSFFSQSKPYTIFAPESNAFGRFTPFQMAYLKHKLGSEDAQILIKQHVYEGLLFSSEIQSRQWRI